MNKITDKQHIDLLRSELDQHKRALKALVTFTEELVNSSVLGLKLAGREIDADTLFGNRIYILKGAKSLLDQEPK